MSAGVSARSVTRSMLPPPLPPIPEQDNDALMARLEELALDLVVRATKTMTRRLAARENAGQARFVEQLKVLTLLHQSIQKSRSPGLSIRHRAAQLADEMYGLRLVLEGPVDLLVPQHEEDPTPTEAWVLRCGCMEMLERVNGVRP